MTEEKDSYYELLDWASKIQAEAERRIREVIRQTVDAHHEAWYDLLMNGTDKASDKSLELLSMKRTYPADRGEV
jgi:DNA-binding transcriptional regulator PaaX